MDFAGWLLVGLLLTQTGITTRDRLGPRAEGESRHSMFADANLIRDFLILGEDQRR